MSLPRLRAPKEHGQILAVPPFEQVGALLERNRTIFQSASLRDLRSLARREILLAAQQYHREAGETVPDTASDRWIVAGHQPELFHPGVWYKNFVLNRLAEKHGATAVNLIVDTDAVKPAILHVPADGKLARVAFDRSSLETPYEERTVEEETTFAELPARLAPILAKWNFTPMLPTFWREVMQQAKRTPLLGERFAAGRRAMERRFGVVQRELPMSRVCQTEAFASFAGSILERLPEFHAIYNRTVHEYRQAHGIRSRSHPVPDLAADGDWLEAPFWAWRKGARRGKLFVRATGGVRDLRVNAESWPTIARSTDAWRALENQGFKVRSRALTTTMFARIALADLFIHGIGGGIYDELTDRIIERFFHLAPPGYLTVSATLLLPLPRFPEATAKERELQRRMRDLRYKPEQFAPPGPETETLILAKREWIMRGAATHPQRVERFEHIRALNGELLPSVVPEMARVRMAVAECRHQGEADAVATRRDYAFCLYPEDMLRTFFANH